MAVVVTRVAMAIHCARAGVHAKCGDEDDDEGTTKNKYVFSVLKV